MKAISFKTLIGLVLVVSCFSFTMNTKNDMDKDLILSPKEQKIITIAASAARGDLSKLKTELNAGLEAGLTINQIKEVLVHLYAYCGFPRSIRGLQTFMEVLSERQSKGFTDNIGPEAGPLLDEHSKYERGKKVLGELTKKPQLGELTGYSAFAPVIDTFLKEHLFADIFERDILTHSERELVTISVLSTIGGVEPMLRSHLEICLNVGITPPQLNHFIGVIRSVVGEKEAREALAVLTDLLKNRK